MQITMKLKESFLDRKKVQQQMDRKTKRALSRQGAFVRRRARSSLRRRKKAAPAGKPPSVHSDEPNVRTIFFVFEPATKTVVVGPVALNTSSLIGPTVPQVHEQGGSATLVTRKKVWRSGTRQTQVNRRRVSYPERPFMEPALRKEMDDPRFMDAWS